MIERNIKKLLLEALKETGDDPEKVECNYYIRHPPYIPGGPVAMMQECLASSLPEGDFYALGGNSEKYIYTLVQTDKAIKIETSASRVKPPAPRAPSR